MQFCTYADQETFWGTAWKSRLDVAGAMSSSWVMGTIPNLGQKRLNLFVESIGKPIASIFQIAAVTRPLMSVGRVCDAVHNVTFDAEKAVVLSSTCDEHCRFVTTPGGSYVAKLKLNNPMALPGRTEQWDSGPCAVLKIIIFVYW